VIAVRALAPPLLTASVLAAVASGVLLLLLPIEGLAVGGLIGGFALPGMLSVGSATTPVLGAMLVARVGHKPVMIGGLLLCALSIALMASGGTALQRAVGAFFNGVGFGLYGLSRITYLSDAVAPDLRGRIVSAVGGMGRVGMFIGPAGGGIVATSMGRGAALYCAALLALTAAFVLLWLPACATVASTEQHRNPIRLVTKVLAEHRRTFATVGVSMLGLALVRNGRMLLVPICGTMLGLDASAVGFVKSMSMGADVLLFYPAGIIMDRFGRKWTAVPCLLVLSLGVILVGHAHDYTSFLWGALIAGVGNGLGSGINMTLAGDFSPRAGRAEFLGVWSLMTEAGSSTSPFLLGAVATALALGPASTVVATMGAGAALLMGTVVRERRG